MKSQKPVYNRPDELSNEISNPLLIAAVISFIGHVVFLGVFIFGPKISFKHNLTPRVIDVTLVSMTPGEGGGPVKAGTSGPKTKKEAAPSAKAEKAPEPKAPEPKAPEPKAPEPKAPEMKAPEPKAPEMKEPAIKEKPAAAPDKEVISLAPKKIAPKESLKKKTFNPEAVVESALKRIEKKVEDSRPEQEPPRPESTNSGMASVKSSIDRMRSAVEKREGGASGKAGIGAGGEGPAGNGTGGGGTGSAPELIYRSQIASYIRENWAYSEQLADKNPHMTAWVMIEVMPDGKIRDFWFEKRSGNAYLDESVSRAIQKSNPLPPFPPGVRQSSIHQGFRFTPTGMQ